MMRFESNSNSVLVSFISLPQENEHGEVGMQEPPAKLPKYVLEPTTCLRSVKILKVTEDARVLSCGDLEKLYAIYVANKTKGSGRASVSLSPAVGHAVVGEGLEDVDGGNADFDASDIGVTVSAATSRRVRVAVRRVRQRNPSRLQVS